MAATPALVEKFKALVAKVGGDFLELTFSHFHYCLSWFIKLLRKKGHWWPSRVFPQKFHFRTRWEMERCNYSRKTVQRLPSSSLWRWRLLLPLLLLAIHLCSMFCSFLCSVLSPTNYRLRLERSPSSWFPSKERKDKNCSSTTRGIEGHRLGQKRQNRFHRIPPLAFQGGKPLLFSAPLFTSLHFSSLLLRFSPSFKFLPLLLLLPSPLPISYLLSPLPFPSLSQPPLSH